MTESSKALQLQKEMEADHGQEFKNYKLAKPTINSKHRPRTMAPGLQPHLRINKAFQAGNVIRMIPGLQHMLYPGLMIKSCFELFLTVHGNHSGKHDPLGGEKCLERKWKGGNAKRHQSICESLDFECCLQIQKLIYQQFMGCRVQSQKFNDDQTIINKTNWH